MVGHEEEERRKDKSTTTVIFDCTFSFASVSSSSIHSKVPSTTLA